MSVLSETHMQNTNTYTENINTSNLQQMLWVVQKNELSEPCDVLLSTVMLSYMGYYMCRLLFLLMRLNITLVLWFILNN